MFLYNISLFKIILPLSHEIVLGDVIKRIEPYSKEIIVHIERRVPFTILADDSSVIIIELLIQRGPQKYSLV